MKKPLPRLIRIAAALTRGAIDLASIMVGVIVIGLIAGVISATVFAVIPWAQDRAAAGNLDAVATAQAVSKTKTGAYADMDELVAAGLIQTADGVGAAAGTSNCYVAAAKSGSGRTFWTTSKSKTVLSSDDGIPDTSWCAPAVWATSSKVTNLVSAPIPTTSAGWNTYYSEGYATTSRETMSTPWGGTVVRSTWVTPPAAKTGGTYYRPIDGIKPGKTYTGSMWVMSETARVLAPSIEWRDDTSTILNANYGARFTLPANTWTRIHVTAVAPERTVSAALTAYAANNADGLHWKAGDTTVATAAMFTEGSTLHAYSDGNTPGWSWTGAPGNSVSTGYPYTLESAGVGTPLATQIGTGAKPLTLTELPAHADRTVYAVTQRNASEPVVADIVHVVASEDGQTGMIRAGTGTTPNYMVRPQFPGGGGADASYGRSETESSGNGKHVLIAAFGDGLKSLRFQVDRKPDAANVHTMDAGSGWTKPVLDLRSTARETGIAAHLFAGAHDRETRDRVATWLAAHYGVPTAA